MKHYIHCHMGIDPNKGGTVGYLTSLLEGFQESPELFTDGTIQHSFMFPDIGPDDRLAMQVDPFLMANTSFPEVYDYLPKNKDRYIVDRRNWFHSTLPDDEMHKVDLKEITSVHIHGAYNFIPFYNFLRSCNLENDVVKVLTAHNPWKPELEDIEILSRFFTPEQLEEMRFFFQRRDYHAFRLADALFFPSEYSMEGYYESWPEFKDIIKGKRIYFSKTGNAKIPITCSREIMRKRLGIPDNAIVFGYLGRFLKVRGYDLYIEAAKQILEKYPNVYFLAIGQKNEIPAIDHPYWIEIPFTAEPGNYLNMMDSLVVANRGSLFDLSMIEALSSGVPIVAAKVGGYKYLENKTSGVIYFEKESSKGLTEALSNFIALDENKIQKMRDDNIRLYETELTLHEFSHGYAETIKQLYDDFNIQQPKRDNLRVPYAQGVDSTRRLLDPIPNVKRPRSNTSNAHPKPQHPKPQHPKPHTPNSAFPRPVVDSVKMGRMAFKQGNYKRSIELYSEHLKHNNNAVNVRRLLAEAYLKSDDRDSAVKQLAISKKYKPKNKNLARRYLKVKYPKLMAWYPDKVFDDLFPDN